MNGSTQPVAQKSGLLFGHTQLPSEQNRPPVHSLPQSPQCFGSLKMSTHTPLQHLLISPGCEKQFLPQAPQWFPLVWVSTQTPPQAV